MKTFKKILGFACFRSEEIQQMMEKIKEEEEKLQKAQNTIAVMTMLKEGTVPETLPTAGRSFLFVFKKLRYLMHLFCRCSWEAIDTATLYTRSLKNHSHA